MRHNWIFLAALALPSAARAQTKEADERVPGHTTRARRDDSYVTVEYGLAPASLYVPIKHGPTVAIPFTPDWSGYLQYLHGSAGFSVAGVDFFGVKEQLYSFGARFYPGTNSFHFIGGLGERRLQMEVGPELGEKLGVPEEFAFTGGKLIEIRNRFVQIGMANEWQWEHGFTLGLGWINVYWPVARGEVRLHDAIDSQAVRAKVFSATGLIRRSPSLELMRLSLGWSF